MKTRIMALALCAAASPAMAQEELQQPAGAPAAFTARPVKGGAYRIEGGRSNTGFIVGRTGVIVIDTEMSPDTAQKALAAIRSVTPKPVSTIIVTHGDPDHIGGLAYYPNVPVLMHENTKTQAQASAADPAGPPMYKAMYAGLLPRLPKNPIGGSRTMTIDGVRVSLLYFGPAHSAGDLVIHLPDQKVVYGGDMMVHSMRFPVAHLNGSTLGWIAAMKAMLALNADIYVPGHGAIEPRAKLQARLTEAETRRERIKALVAEGKTLAEIEQALPDPTDNPMFLTFTQTVHAELTKGYPPLLPPWANIVRRP